MWQYFATLQMLKIIPRKHHGLVDVAFRYAERCQRAFQRLQPQTLLASTSKVHMFFGISGECWNLQMLQISATRSFRAWSACAYHSIYTKIGRMIAPIAQFGVWIMLKSQSPWVKPMFQCQTHTAVWACLKIIGTSLKHRIWSLLGSPYNDTFSQAPSITPSVAVPTFSSAGKPYCCAIFRAASVSRNGSEGIELRLDGNC